MFRTIGAAASHLPVLSSTAGRVSARSCSTTATTTTTASNPSTTAASSSTVHARIYPIAPSSSSAASTKFSTTCNPTPVVTPETDSAAQNSRSWVLSWAKPGEFLANPFRFKSCTDAVMFAASQGWQYTVEHP